MSSPNENEKNIKAKHNDLCFKLNVDRVAANVSWETYKRISKNCTLDVSFTIIFIIIFYYR